MTNKQVERRALSMIWGYASYFYEGIEKGELSDNLHEDVATGCLTEKDAYRIQKMLKKHGDILMRKIRRLSNNEPCPFQEAIRRKYKLINKP